MDERAVAAVLAAVAVVAVATQATPVAAAPPSVSVGVGGTPLDPGEAYHTDLDPWVNVTVDAETEIELVEVRVDGTTRHTFEPASKRFSRSVNLDLATGERRLTVVARADEVTTYEATLVKDDVKPVVNYTSPFAETATAADEPPSTELTVSRGNVTVSGSLTDHSAIDYVRIDHRYQYRAGGNDSRVGHREYLLYRPGASFNQSLSLAPGVNDVTLEAVDVVGNVREHEFTVAVDDETAPAVNVSHVEWLSPTRLRIEGTATDRVQVDAVWAQGPNATTTAAETNVGNGTRHHLVFPTSTEPDPNRSEMRFDAAVYNPPGADHVVVGANDTAGNEATRNLSLSTFLAPTVTFDDPTTGYVDDGTVTVGGRIVDGQVANVSVETVDPATGATVDIRPVERGVDGTFRTRLDAPSDETVVRIRVRDVSGAEHLTTTNVSAPVERTPAGGDGGADGDDGAGSDGGEGASDGGTGDADGEDDAGGAGVRIPFVGVTLPLGPLAASVSLPLPFVGPIRIPAVAVAGLALLLVVGLGVVAARS
jgi:hypothetical protein